MQISTSLLFNTTNQKDTKTSADIKASINTSSKTTAQASALVQEAKSNSIGDFLDSLMKNISKNESSKETIIQVLKNSQISKNIENTPSLLQNLVKTIKSDETLQKYASKLENFLLDIKNIDTKNIKTQIQNSGTLLESKLADTIGEKNLPQEIKNILKSLETTLKASLPTTKQSTQLSGQIKEFISLLKDTKSVQKGLVKEVQSLFDSIKNDFKLSKEVLQQLNKFETIFKANENTTLVKNLQDLKSTLIENTNKQITANKIETIIKSLQDILQNPKSLSKDFTTDIKNLLETTKGLPLLKKPLAQTLFKLETLVQNTALSESKIKNQTPPLAQEIKQLQTQIKESLSDLRTVLNSPKLLQLPILKQNVDTITKLIDTILAQKNFFQKEPLTLDTSSKISNVIELVKSQIKNTDIKQSHTTEILKNITILEKALGKELSVLKMNPTKVTSSSESVKNILANDVKATLLQLKQELTQTPHTSAKELLLQVDKAINQMEYYQLNSHVNNSLNSYLPFLWQGLEKGEISFKKLKENRFFCEINLELKEYGKIDLMLMLYEDINVNISVFSQKQEFVKIFEQNIKELRIGLNKLGLVPVNIQTFDALKDEKIKKQTHDFVGTQQIDMGVNIKV